MTRLLVAEDSETVLMMLTRRLEMAGYEVTTATDGHQVMEAVGDDKGAPPDVIVLDAMMPRMSGIDALKKLRASGVETPILILSAHRYADEPEEALALGADACVGKPFEWDELIDQIEELAEPGR